MGARIFSLLVEMGHCRETRRFCHRESDQSFESLILSQPLRAKPSRTSLDIRQLAKPAKSIIFAGEYGWHQGRERQLTIQSDHLW